MKKFDSLTTRWLALAVCSSMSGTVLNAETPSQPEAAKPEAAKAKTKSTKAKTPRVRGTANARILHAIKGGAPVDVYIDDKKVLTAADYKSVSDYVAYSSGKRLIKITEVGKAEALFNGSFTFTKDKYFTIAVYGTPEKPLLLRVNETTGKLYEGKTRVFVTHLAQAPGVDITTASTRNKTLGYATFVKTLEPGKTRAKTTGAGDATFQVRSGGAVLKDASTKLESGKRYSVFAIGTVDAVELLVKPAATGYVETLAVPKPKKAKTPKTTAATTAKTATKVSTTNS